MSDTGQLRVLGQSEFYVLGHEGWMPTSAGMTAALDSTLKHLKIVIPAQAGIQKASLEEKVARLLALQ